MSNEDLLEESNRLISEMVALALQGERLQKLPIGKGIDEPAYQAIFRELIARARLMEKKNGEIVAYAKESMAELDSEGIEIRKHLKLLDVWRRRALARLGEVDALRKNLVSLIVASEECSARFSDQLLVQEKRPEKPLPASVEELMASLYEKRTRAEVEEKIVEE